MSKSVPEIYEFLGKKLLKFENEDYQNLILTFKDQVVKYENLKEEKI